MSLLKKETTLIFVVVCLCSSFHAMTIDQEFAICFQVCPTTTASTTATTKETVPTEATTKTPDTTTKAQVTATKITTSHVATTNTSKYVAATKTVIPPTSTIVKTSSSAAVTTSKRTTLPAITTKTRTTVPVIGTKTTIVSPATTAAPSAQSITIPTHTTASGRDSTKIFSTHFGNSTSGSAGSTSNAIAIENESTTAVTKTAEPTMYIHTKMTGGTAATDEKVHVNTSYVTSKTTKPAVPPDATFSVNKSTTSKTTKTKLPTNYTSTVTESSMATMHSVSNETEDSRSLSKTQATPKPSTYVSSSAATTKMLTTGKDNEKGTTSVMKTTGSNQASETSTSSIENDMNQSTPIATNDSSQNTNMAASDIPNTTVLTRNESSTNVITATTPLGDQFTLSTDASATESSAGHSSIKTSILTSRNSTTSAMTTNHAMSAGKNTPTTNLPIPRTTSSSKSHKTTSSDVNSGQKQENTTQHTVTQNESETMRTTSPASLTSTNNISTLSPTNQTSIQYKPTPSPKTGTKTTQSSAPLNTTSSLSTIKPDTSLNTPTKESSFTKQHTSTVITTASSNNPGTISTSEIYSKTLVTANISTVENSETATKPKNNISSTTKMPGNDSVILSTATNKPSVSSNTEKVLSTKDIKITDSSIEITSSTNEQQTVTTNSETVKLLSTDRLSTTYQTTTLTGEITPSVKTPTMTGSIGSNTIFTDSTVTKSPPTVVTPEQSSFTENPSEISSPSVVTSAPTNPVAMTTRNTTVDCIAVCRSWGRTPLHIPISTSSTNTGLTTKIPSPYDDVQPQWDIAMFHLSFTLSFNITWVNNYGIISSSEFGNLSRRIIYMLENVYMHIPDVRNMKVIEFRYGSVICNYTIMMTAAVYKEPATYNNTFSQIRNAQLQLESMHSYNGIGNFSTDYIKDNRPTELSLAQQNSQSPCMALDICPIGYTCNYLEGVTTCKHLCRDSNPCQNGGECFVNEHGEIGCKCISSDDRVYFGEHCGSFSERLSLESKYIIAIACSSAAVLVLIIIFVCCVIVRKKPFDRGEYSFQEFNDAYYYRSTKDVNTIHNLYTVNNGAYNDSYIDDDVDRSQTSFHEAKI